jgi:PKD repeat protein
MLVPRIKGWVAANYPGLKTAITEYNWGAEGHINGATTQADIYGILGREGLDIATRWTTPDPSTPTYKAMKMYRNYDGLKSTFGETSVAASVPNPDNLSAFAALRASDGALTVMVISKVLSGATPITVNLANFVAGGVAEAWQLTSANTIARLANVSFTGSAFTTSVPAQSVTLYVVAAGGESTNQPPLASISASPTSGVAPLAVTFSGAGSSDPDGSIASYAWNFGDGATGSGVSAAHTYAAAGNYTATLTVTDLQNATGSASVTIAATADSNAISAPSGLSASTARKGSVTLRWTDNSTNETGFAIERAPSGSSAFAQVGQVAANTTTFAQSGVASGTYSYRVRAFNATTGRVSAYSNTVSVRVK